MGNPQRDPVDRTTATGLMATVTEGSYDMHAYPGSLSWMDYEYDERVREALGLSSLHQPSTARNSRPSFDKIRAAIDHAKDQGAWVDNLRPGERYRRLAEQWKLMGYKNSEIPNIRTVREYFNCGPGRRSA